MKDRWSKRKLADFFRYGSATFSMLFSLIVLFGILIYIFSVGSKRFSLRLFTADYEQTLYTVSVDSSDQRYTDPGIKNSFFSSRYGVCLEDQESRQPYVEGFVVNELARLGSHFRKNMDLEDYLKKHDIVGIQGVDTRYITKLIRNKGCMNGLITTHHYDDLSDVLKRIHEYKVSGVVKQTTCCEPYVLGKGAYKVALYDFGAKQNIARELVKRNCEVTVFPADTPAKTILEGHFDGIMLSNGPGDPEECVDIIENMNNDNTYKSAWGRALLELIIELNVVQDVNVFSFQQIAVKMLKYYWNQIDFFQLKQSPAKKPIIVQETEKCISYVNQIRQMNNPIWFDLAEDYLKKDLEFYQKRINKIAITLKHDVSWRFKKLKIKH